MDQYKDRPIVLRNVFDEKVHQTILKFVNEFVPLFPLGSDVRQPQGPNRFGRKYAHNLPFFVDLHYQLKNQASELFGQKVKPSYVFLSMYEKDGNCPLHVDRPQCRFTIDYLIQQETSESWPIKIGRQMSDAKTASITNGHPQTKDEIEKIIKNQDWTECLLNPNDAVCYSGTNAWHYRPIPSKGKVDLAFFHFVPEKFDGPLN